MAAGREALQGLNEGLKSFGEAMRAIGEVLYTCASVISKGISFICQKIFNAAYLCLNFMQQLLRAYYNLVGKYTFPLEQLLCRTLPPNISDLNLIGTVILSPLALTAMLASVTIAPLLGNSCISFALGWAYTYNFAVFDTERYRMANLLRDDPRGIIAEIYGLPGLLLGGSVGLGFAALAISLRIITNSLKSFDWTCVDMFAMFFKGPNGPVFERFRPNFFKCYVMGFVGALAGFTFGSVCFTLLSNALSFTRGFVTLLNYGLHKDQQLIPLPEDKRTRFGWIVGIPGIFMGSVSSLLVGIPTVIFARIIGNSYYSGRVIFAEMINLALPTTYQLTITEDSRDSTSKWLGFPGVAVGFLGGCAGIVITCMFRTLLKMSKYFILHNVRSFQQGDNWVKNAIFPDNDLNITPPLDERTWQQKYFTGGLGLLTGIILGGMAAILVSNFISMLRTTQLFTNVILTAANRFIIKKDERNPTAFCLGLPGYALGVIPGLIGMAGAFLGRIIINSCQSLDFPFIPLVNKILHKDDQFTLSPDERTLPQKFLGLPGVAISLMAAVFIGMPVVFCARVVVNSFASFAALGSAIVNCGLEKPYLNAIAADNVRTNIEKFAWGGLGYLAAIGVATPLSAVIFTVRYTPIIISAALGIAVSPLVAIYRATAELLKMIKGKQRFQSGEENIKSVSDVINAFKNIYSSLTIMGNLKKGQYIADNQNGNKAWGTFFRKSVTFNVNTLTERTLNTLLDHYQRSTEHTAEGDIGLDFFKKDNAAFKNAIQELQAFYSSDCFASSKEIQAMHYQVKSIGEFVRQYILDRVEHEAVAAQVVNIEQPEGIPWRVCFLGNIPQQDNQPAEQAAAAIPAP